MGGGGRLHSVTAIVMVNGRKKRSNTDDTVFVTLLWCFVLLCAVFSPTSSFRLLTRRSFERQHIDGQANAFRY